MLSKCANPTCSSSYFKKDGTFYRPSDGRHVQRFRCKVCKKQFSASTFQRTFRQNKRRVNHPVYKYICSGVSMRRTALNLNIHRTTVARKLAYLAGLAIHKQQKYLKSSAPIKHFHFDDLITLEHTKCKPLSVSLGVESKTRKIIGFEISEMPASGPLAEISRRRYGRRPNNRPFGIQTLFKRIQKYLDESVTIYTDEDVLYPKYVKKYFPKATHKRFKGAKSRSSGLGELKKLRNDPLFSINHTFAMLRANINRLIRRTWCTTKKKECLIQHLSIYMHFHNTILIAQTKIAIG